MLAVERMRDIVGRLLKSTVAGGITWVPDNNLPGLREIESSLGEEHDSSSISSVSFAALLPNSKVQLIYVAPAESDCFIQFLFYQSDGTLLGSWLVREVPSADWEVAKSLFDHVSDHRSVDWDVFSTDIEKTMGESAANAKGAKRFLAWASAGKWHLDWYRLGRRMGGEEVRIDLDGDYYVDNNPEPSFHLREIYFNEEGNTVRFTKVEARGSKVGDIRQTEILRVDFANSEMNGFAEHDNHRLQYRRVS